MKTNVQQTSIDAYYDQLMKGINQKYQVAIIKYMLSHKQPRTGREIGEALQLPANIYSARCNDLIRANVLEKCGKHKNPGSKMQANLLRLVDPCRPVAIGDMFGKPNSNI